MLKIKKTYRNWQKLTKTIDFIGQTNGSTNAITNNGYGNGNQAQSQYVQQQNVPVAPPPPPFNSGF